MNASHPEPYPLRPEEWRDGMLNAAVVLRDVSFLRFGNRCVSLGCRAAMREHALQWRTQLSPNDAAGLSPSLNLEARDSLAMAA